MGSYEACVVTELATWKASTGLLLLGKSCFERLVRALEKYNASLEAAADSGGRLPSFVWLTVFDAHYTGTAFRYMEYHMLTGLLTDDLWRTLFKKPETAHALVVVATRYVETHATSANRAYGEAIELRLAAAMSEWLAPGLAIEAATVRDVAVALFGEPWCAVVADNRIGGESLADVIRLRQPEFLPRRLAASAEQQAAPLPDMT